MLYNLPKNIGSLGKTGSMSEPRGEKSFIRDALGKSVLPIATLRQFREQQKNDIPEYKMASRMPYGVVLHCGTFRSAWDLIIFICTIYVAALVPYQAVFKKEGYDLMSSASNSTGNSLFKNIPEISIINRGFDVFVEGTVTVS